MTDPDTISADYTLRPSELADALALLVEARQPAVVWGPPGSAKSDIAQQVAAAAGREYIDVRALLLDPVDLRGIPWRDGADRTRWAPPSFLPPSDDPGRWLINLEELPSALPMVQAALYQLVLDRKCGEYELPEGASLIACGNRESDRGVTHRMPTPLASRFVHLEIRVDAADWCCWAAVNGIAAEVIFFIQLRPELLHQFDPQSREAAFACPRTWSVVRRGILTPYWGNRRPKLMEWTPPPDGIAVCQGGGVTNPQRRRHPWNRLTSSGSIWRSAAFRGRRTELRPRSCSHRFAPRTQADRPLRRDGTPDSSMGGAADHGSISLG